MHIERTVNQLLQKQRCPTNPRATDIACASAPNELGTVRFHGRVPLVRNAVWMSMTKNNKRNSTGERSELRLSLPPPLPNDGDEILWCELVEHDNEVLAEWTAEIGELFEVTTEQLLQGPTRKRKGNEKGSNVHEKSLIWAAKDTEWKNLEEKGPLRILTGASAEEAKAQLGDRFIPSRFDVNRPGPEEFKARWCLRGYLDPNVMELAGSGATQSPTVSQLGRMLSCQMIVSNGWEFAVGGHSRCISGGRRFGPEERIAVLKLSSRRNSRGARWIGDTDFGKHLWSERCTGGKMMQS